MKIIFGAILVIFGLVFLLPGILALIVGLIGGLIGLVAGLFGAVFAMVAAIIAAIFGSFIWLAEGALIAALIVWGLYLLVSANNSRRDNGSRAYHR